MSAIKKFDPFRELNVLDSVLRSTFNGGPFSSLPFDPNAKGGMISTFPDFISAYAPNAETFQDGANLVVRVDVPGVDPSEIKVELKNSKIVISGERSYERSEDLSGTKVREIRYGKFTRSFGVPAHVEASDVSASYSNGVLEVRAANAFEEPESTVIKVNVDSPPSIQSSEPTPEVESWQSEGGATESAPTEDTPSK